MFRVARKLLGFGLMAAVLRAICTRLLSDAGDALAIPGGEFRGGVAALEIVADVEGLS